MKPAASLVLLVLLIGIIASGISFVFIRESVESSIMLSAWRSLLASLFLLPLYIRARRLYGDTSWLKVLSRSLLPGILLSIHFIAWNAGARLTSGANATLIVNLTPIVMPFLMFIQFRERIQRLELFATLLAMAGIVLLAYSDFSLSREHILGDLFCFASMLLFALYLTSARKHQQLASIWLYVVPMYAVAGVCSLLLASISEPIAPTMDTKNILMILSLAGISTVIGHTALNFSMQHLRGQTVTLLNLLQFVVAGVAAYFLYQELPSTLFYPASLLVLSGLILVVFNQHRREAR